MGDTTTLVSELLVKLAELNQKVCDYRQDMVQEFQRYQQRLLHDAPEHVSAHVEEVLAAELHNYPSLSPAFALDATSADLGRSAVDRWSRNGRTGSSSPPPLLPHTSGVPPNDVVSGSPLDRNREREFRGLFTPGYLPLLDDMQPNRTTSAPTVFSSPATPRDNDSDDPQAPLPQPDTTPQRPDPVRHYTEETTSSVNSDDSVSRTRRSALRRSSSASMKDIQSPRRVRFDVEGEEVLPTVSPPISPRIYDFLKSPPPEEEHATPFYESLNQAVSEEDASMFGSSPPRPKKISSTERLKALARSSTEDTSKWTIVGDMHDDDEEEEGLVMFSSKKKSKAPVPALRNGTDSYCSQIMSSNDLTKESLEGDQRTGEMVDDLLELTPLTSFKDKKRFSPSQEALEIIPEVTTGENLQRPPSDEKLPGSALVSQSHTVQDREEEDMFKFDHEESALEPQAVTNTSKYIEEEQEEVEEQTTPLADNSAEEPPISLYSTSPAIPIIRPASLQAGSASSVSKRMGASAGSYKGKPFIIGVIRDEELYKKAEEMGDVYTFIGSVDGRSGVDPSESFRHAPPFYSPSTPRSLNRHRIADNAPKQVSNAADHTD
ncbi:hypothetical protein F4860DRAFT_283932 [Xylaria cubensis]|nr:hypothetical protein F4860DRAFT_283932 [Xylaria cubensis]